MPLYEFEGRVPVVHPTAYVHETACVIGDVSVEAHCYVGPNAVLRGDLGTITIGQGSNVQDNCVMHASATAGVILEPNSHIGHAAVLHGCRIGAFAMVGIGAVVLDGAELGSGAVLGANALLTQGKRISPGMLAHGSPAREVSEVDEALASRIRAGVRTYQRLAQRSRVSLRRVRPPAP